MEHVGMALLYGAVDVIGVVSSLEELVNLRFDSVFTCTADGISWGDISNLSAAGGLATIKCFAESMSFKLNDV